MTIGWPHISHWYASASNDEWKSCPLGWIVAFRAPQGNMCRNTWNLTVIFVLLIPVARVRPARRLMGCRRGWIGSPSLHRAKEPMVRFTCPIQARTWRSKPIHRHKKNPHFYESSYIRAPCVRTSVCISSQYSHFGPFAIAASVSHYSCCFRADAFTDATCPGFGRASAARNYREQEQRCSACATSTWSQNNAFCSSPRVTNVQQNCNAPSLGMSHAVWRLPWRCPTRRRTIPPSIWGSLRYVPFSRLLLALSRTTLLMFGIKWVR